MTKRTQLIEYITQDVITYLMEDQPLDMSEAMRRFYTSETYEKLLEEETGLYLESSAYIYDLFKNECQNGQIVQNEI
jgi:hypothetical protein